MATIIAIKDKNTYQILLASESTEWIRHLSNNCLGHDTQNIWHIGHTCQYCKSNHTP